MEKHNYHGSCLCGDVTFSVEHFSQLAAHCHCTMCRKFHGAAFGTLVGVSGLKWLTGESLLKEYRAPNGTVRTFCSQCGSSLAFRSRHHSAMEIALAAFDEPVPVQPDAHIYTHYKADWYLFDNTLPRYGEGRGSETVE